MKTLTDLFDFSCCINLDRRPDRWEESIKEFNKWGLNNINRAPAIDAHTLPTAYPDVYKSVKGNIGNIRSMGNIGLILTNLQIFEYAKEQKFSQILIMEDDVYFTSEINNIESLISYVPNDWDMLYMGGNHNYHNKGSKAQPIPINDHVIKCQHTFTTHCYAVKSHMYDILTSRLSKLDAPIDVIYTEIQKEYNVYSIYPSVAKQREGFSDIENAFISSEKYNSLIK